MATTASVQTYIKETIKDLDVIPIYEDLMKASVDKNSIYIRAKDTMKVFFDNSNIKDDEKATILSQMLVNMTTSITAQAMNSAIAIAKENREGVYALTKLREDTKLVQEQRDKLAADNQLVNADIALKGAQTDKMVADANNAIFSGWKLQTDIIRDNGVKAAHGMTTATVIVPSTALENAGVKYASILQANVGAHAAMAKSIMESGSVTWTMTAPGSVTATEATDGLTLAQTKVAKRQVIAFEDNKRQHAANSSAAMMSMLISSGDSGLINGDITATTGSPLDLWESSIVDLTTDAPTI